MKIITEPAVHLLAVPKFYPHPKYQLPPDGSEIDRLIATGGKVCYDTYGLDGNPVSAHVKNLVASGHHSVIEHAHVSVFIEGISRGCSHEIVRHRMFNYSQRSTRYTAEEDAAIVLDPYYAELYMRNYRGDTELTEDEQYLLAEFLDSAKRSLAAYVDQIDSLSTLAPKDLSARDKRKWCRGKARQLLPHALETRMVMTGNLRAWRHFFIMRTSRHAEAEIRRLAQLLWNELIDLGLGLTVYDNLEVDTVNGFIEVTEAK